MATATDQLTDDPLGFGLDLFDRWSNYHIQKEQAKAASQNTAADDQAALIGAPGNVTQRPNAETQGAYGVMNQGNPNIMFAGIEFNKTALMVGIAALVVALVLKVVK